MYLVGLIIGGTDLFTMTEIIENNNIISCHFYFTSSDRFLALSGAYRYNLEKELKRGGMNHALHKNYAGQAT
jgi:hypothetical protein